MSDTTNLFTTVSLLPKFADKIVRLPSTVNLPLSKQELLTSDFLLYREDELEIYYSRHNETVNRDAHVMMIGITPGCRQMEAAYRRVRADLRNGYVAVEDICGRAKKAARFAGTMRDNLISMLDRLTVACQARADILC